MNEKHLKLFTPVEEGLPEKSGWYLAVLDGKNIGLYRYNSTSKKWYDLFNFNKEITHWLDLSKLTTKAAALELAEDALTEFSSKIRTAIAEYKYSEGCSCCRSSNHEENAEKLAIALNVEKYEDGSGYNWSKYIEQNKSKS